MSLALSIRVVKESLAMSIRRRPGMTSRTDGRGAVLLVTLQANAHRCDAGRFGHSVHLRDIPVAHLAFHSCVQMFAMRPGYARQNFVDAHPGNWLAGFRE